MKNSVWIGGNADGGLHERAPYWLNGIVPLAYLLKNVSLSSNLHNHNHDHSEGESICSNGTDMMFYDIEDFTVSSV